MSGVPSRSAKGPGRVCPLDYRTDPADLMRPPDLIAHTVYVIGGLYGNAFALDAIEALAAAEHTPITLLFNGDAHWFDADGALFRRLDERLARHPAIAGNIEFEVARDIDAGAGCGCAYPPRVSDDIVARSNDILRRLKGVVPRGSPIRARLRALPMNLVAEVGGVRVGIVHGDPASLAGWGFSAEALDDPASLGWLDGIRRDSRIGVFASTHTCGAAMRDIGLRSGRLVVANNGAAGMGNFAGDSRGLITRISTTSSPHPLLYGLRYGPVWIDALPVAFDVEAFVSEFDQLWPRGSPGEISYRGRILGEAAGPTVRDAMTRRHDSHSRGTKSLHMEALLLPYEAWIAR
jgi:hypothetical protein